MSFAIALYKHNKKVNSTSQPTQDGTTISVYVNIKDASNLFSPTLVLTADLFKSGDNFVNPMDYNYCYIPDFKRYYFIKQWNWILGRWECRLEVDVLASFKTEIGNSTLYVLRSASKANGRVLENKYPVIKKIHFAETTLSPDVSPWCTNLKNASISEGFYCVGIANNDANALGSVAYYAFSCSALRDLMYIMYRSPSWLDVTDAGISSDLQKMLLNPLQYIVSCTWIPVGFDTTGLTGINTIPVGWWSLDLPVGVVAYRINASNTVIIKDFYFLLQNHPQRTGNEYLWLNLSPYTNVSLSFAPFGMIPLDTLRLTNADGIGVYIWIDVISGKATLHICRAYYENNQWTPREEFYQTVSQLGVPMALAQMAVDMGMIGNASSMVAAGAMGALSGEGLQKLETKAASGIGKVLSNPRVQDIASRVGLSDWLERKQTSLADVAAQDSGGSLIDSVKETAADIGNAMIAAMGQCSSSGATGSFGMLAYQPRLIHYYQYIADVDPVHNGYPLCEMTQIKTLSGFILVGNADDFSANCMAVERQAVLNYLEGGFYYE